MPYPQNQIRNREQRYSKRELDPRTNTPKQQWSKPSPGLRLHDSGDAGAAIGKIFRWPEGPHAPARGEGGGGRRRRVCFTRWPEWFQIFQIRSPDTGDRFWVGGDDREQGKKKKEKFSSWQWKKKQLCGSEEERRESWNFKKSFSWLWYHVVR